ncbi:hypothetical protein ABDE16_09055 [Streptomyces sp. BRB040]
MSAGHPYQLRLRVSYTAELDDVPQADTLERWDMIIPHEGPKSGR